MVREVLLSQPALLFRGIITVFGTARWDFFKDIWKVLLGFVARMAFYVFGHHNPAFQILKTLYRDNETFWSSSEHSLQCLLQALGISFQPLHPEVLRTKRDLTIVLRRQEEQDSAEQTMRQIITDCESGLGLVHVETLRCLRHLAGLYLHRGKYDEAEELLTEALRRAGRPDNTAGPITDDTDTFIHAHRDLALIAMQQNDMAKCQSRLQQFAKTYESKLNIVDDYLLPLLPEDLTLIGAEIFVKDMVIAYNLHCDELASKFMTQTTERARVQEIHPS